MTGNGFIDLYSTAGSALRQRPDHRRQRPHGHHLQQHCPALGHRQPERPVWLRRHDLRRRVRGASATNVTVDATNGFRIRTGTTNKFVADTSGNLSIVGDLSVGTSGVIRSGATSYASGTGWIMEHNGGTPRFRIGNPSGNRLTWDGTTLSVVGDGSGLTSIDGGNITTGTINVGSINATGFGGNQIRNGSFEGATTAAQLSGWKKGSDSPAAPASRRRTWARPVPTRSTSRRPTGFYTQALHSAFTVDASTTQCVVRPLLDGVRRRPGVQLCDVRVG